MFFMTFYLENVHGLSPIAAGVHLLPMTAMLIIGSPIAGTLISRIGPRIPIFAGMAMAAVAMFGLSRLGATSSPDDTIIWFVLLGLGLAPVMVGATNVIVGNAPAELAGVAGGLQSTAMQLGGTFGTAVLGAIMSARIDSLLPARWHAAHLPPLTAAGYAQVKNAVSVGVAPVPSGTPAKAAGVLFGPERKHPNVRNQPQAGHHSQPPVNPIHRSPTRKEERHVRPAQPQAGALVPVPVQPRRRPGRRRRRQPPPPPRPHPPWLATAHDQRRYGRRRARRRRRPPPPPPEAGLTHTPAAQTRKVEFP
jgi:hypothetical protein